MELIILWIIFGIIVGLIAQHKGRSFGLWWFYGAMIFIIALPHALLMSPTEDAVESRENKAGRQRCPSCQEFIMKNAKICRYCNHSLAE
ncbi:MAG: hypothetical protein CMH22_07070 [Methylophaga sp.]|jgi:hypothetical protein|nr:hypothetical protein [Methylophaga sp.]WVI83985.1 hypothetical protein VSX76_09385 [Methylophaga thalassica]|tara:strand:+ start:18909 stop:19175 length:267 start_codon:yes stop_codon:yes gene_type:complete